MELNLVSLLTGKEDREDAARKGKFNGVTVGKVTDINDKAHLGRIKVSFPHIADGCQSGWARLAMPWAGQQRGSYFVPEVDDEVMVAFEHSDIRFPVVIGCVWSGKAVPPETDPNLERRGLRSKTGHQLVFDDSAGRQNLTVKSQGGHQLVLDDTSGSSRIVIADAQQKVSIVLDVSSGKVTISATTGEIDLEASKLTIHGQSIELNADSSLDLKGTSVTLNGQAVQIN